jgi:hypothetical protein
LNTIYAERNALAVAFCKAAVLLGWPAGRGTDSDHPEWGSEWRHVVYVELPGGQQVSWHIAPAQIDLLDGLPTYTGEWDGTFAAREQGWVAGVGGSTKSAQPAEPS